MKRFEFSHVVGKSKKKKSLDKSEKDPAHTKSTPYKPTFNQVTLLKQFRTKVTLEVRRAFLDPYFLSLIHI